MLLMSAKLSFACLLFQGIEAQFIDFSPYATGQYADSALLVNIYELLRAEYLPHYLLHVQVIEKYCRVPIWFY